MSVLSSQGLLCSFHFLSDNQGEKKEHNRVMVDLRRGEEEHNWAVKLDRKLHIGFDLQCISIGHRRTAVNPWIREVDGWDGGQTAPDGRITFGALGVGIVRPLS